MGIWQLMLAFSFTPDFSILIILLKGIVLIFCHLFFFLAYLNSEFIQELCTPVKMLIGHQPYYYCHMVFSVMLQDVINTDIRCSSGFIAFIWNNFWKYSVLMELSCFLSRFVSPRNVVNRHEWYLETLILGILFLKFTADTILALEFSIDLNTSLALLWKHLCGWCSNAKNGSMFP